MDTGNTERPKFAMARVVTVGALGLVALLAACEAKLPTSAEIDAMDAASAERNAVHLGLLKPAQAGAVYRVDGTIVSEAQAKGLAPESIDAMEIEKSSTGAPIISIRIKPSVANRASDVGYARQAENFRVRRAPRGALIDGQIVVDTLVVRATLKPSDALGAQAAPAPLLFVDGVKRDAALVHSLDPKTIESVEVLKGAAAAQVYGAEAANGVIVITTRRGGK